MAHQSVQGLPWWALQNLVRIVTNGTIKSKRAGRVGSWPPCKMIERELQSYISIAMDGAAGYHGQDILPRPLRIATSLRPGFTYEHTCPRGAFDDLNLVCSQSRSFSNYVVDSAASHSTRSLLRKLYKWRTQESTSMLRLMIDCANEETTGHCIC